MKKILITLMMLLVCLWSNGQTFREILKTTGSDIVGSSERFGYSVSVDGDYAMVGAPGNILVNAPLGVGAAYVFKKDNTGNWSEVQKLVPNNVSISNRGDNFGFSVAISGKYAVIGARNTDGSGNNQNDIGAAYVFERNANGIWIERQKLTASDPIAFDDFGNGLAIDDDNILIGAPGVDVNDISFVGGVYVFSRNSNGVWEETQKITPSELDDGSFGRSIAIDGNKAIVGYFDDGLSQLIDRQGSAYIYEKDSNGTWNQAQKIVASDGTEKDLFGGSVAIEDNYIVVGAYSDKDEQDPAATINRGSIYIFERNSSGIWNEKQKIIPSFHSLPDKLFGFSVSINNGFIAVGAPFEDFDINTNTDEGAVYIYEHDVVNDFWVENHRLLSSDLIQHNSFGFDVDLQDNTLVVVSSGNFNFNAGGSAYFYEFCRKISIPDTNFEQWLVNEQIDSDGLVNGSISDCDAKKVTELNIPPLQGIASLTGISAFTNLEILSIPENDVVTIDLSNNTKLISINCYFNLLEEIDITNCNSLVSLNVSDNFLTGLDISGIDDLQSLDARTNANLTCIEVKDLAEASTKSSGRRPKWRVDNPSSIFSLNCPVPATILLSKNEKMRIRNKRTMNNDILMFPTKITNGKLTVLVGKDQYFDVILYDLQGNIIEENYDILRQKDFNVSGLLPGLYMAKIRQDGRDTVKKFIIGR
ncbi:T9SS type A sorting domain-containing protein [Aquimarina algiphila]|uniref:T9SS type A sorting domain-containing protein n=1 Tax=Aquimarina algiphila TaxID=2047982 RepID=UPI00232DBBDC|nr:T9SS type A sorting domain-containing protein [Aquimarina algiphila]